ncbi:Na+/H+ antiporter [Blastocladiella emersonii ATCC 22665]|nr:Na+/H+ antiporter [Blastocladiella emersonii ATCC 22665]
MIDSILQITDINRVSLAIGGFILLFCCVSLLVRERLYIGETTFALIFGIAIGGKALKLVHTEHWNEELVTEITFECTRFVIALQVCFAGAELPARYLWKEPRSINMLLFVLMTFKWLLTAAMVSVILGMNYLDALIIASCVAPTDPVLANAIVKGKYAERHVPEHIRALLSAESGANDGLGFPFLFLALYLRTNASVGAALWQWAWYICGYQIILGTVLGAALGYGASKALTLARKHDWIDRPSRLSYSVSLAILCVGVVGMLGSDDLLAAFVAGHFLNWNGKFGRETHGEAVNDTLDQILTPAFFVFWGASAPWHELAHLYPWWKLLLPCFGVLFFRRLPLTLALYRWIPAIKSWNEAVFVGWFGPMGVSGLFYAYLLLHNKDTPDRVRREVVPLVSMLVLLSVICHGMSIASFKMTKKVARANTIGDLSDALTKTLFPGDNPKRRRGSGHTTESDETAELAQIVVPGGHAEVRAQQKQVEAQQPLSRAEANEDIVYSHLEQDGKESGDVEGVDGQDDAAPASKRSRTSDSSSRRLSDSEFLMGIKEVFQSVATADSKPVLTAALEWVQDAYNDNEEYQIDVATRLTEDQALRVMAVSESKRKRILEIFIQ